MGGQLLEPGTAWLRWYDRAGNWIPTSDEIAKQERQRAEAALRKAEQLAAKLQELGVDPDRV
jgi:hypothetical protein